MAKVEQRDAAGLLALKAITDPQTDVRRFDASFSSSFFGNLSPTPIRELSSSASSQGTRKGRILRRTVNDDFEARVVKRGIRIDPEKLDRVAALIRGKSVAVALSNLEVARSRFADPVKRTLQDAIASAENKHDLRVDLLVVAEAYVGRSLMMKRHGLRSRRHANQVEKPHSQLTIVVREFAANLKLA